MERREREKGDVKIFCGNDTIPEVSLFKRGFSTRPVAGRNHVSKVSFKPYVIRRLVYQTTCLLLVLLS